MYVAQCGRADARAPLMLAITIAAGTTAYADPVRYENDGSFAWTDDVVLDLTKPAEEQTGQPISGRASFLYDRRDSQCCAPHESVWVFGSAPGAQIEGYPVSSVRELGAIVPDDFSHPVYGQRFLSPSVLGYYYGGGAGFYTQFDKPLPFGVPGDAGYIAARFDIDGATHYGWMSLALIRGGGIPNWRFELLAWGYETEPNTPLPAGAVPAPSGALALLAFGAAAGATRARRE